VIALAAIHDVAPATLAACQRLRERLAGWGYDRVALLAVPAHHGGGRLDRAPAAAAWLRERAAAGDEVVLHGHVHLAARSAPGLGRRVRARLTTADEGECLAQTAAERERMLTDGRRIVEDACGGAVVGFVAPAWLAPPELEPALWAHGFAWHETTGELRTRAGAVPGLVIGLASRSASRRLAARLYAGSVGPLLVRRALLGRAPFRLALHPGDVGHPPLLAAVEPLARRAAAALPVGVPRDVAVAPPSRRPDLDDPSRARHLTRVE
jgi:predicted deacetylase